MSQEITSLYDGPQIKIDLENKKFKRDADNEWMKLPSPISVVLTQRKMSQRGGLRGTFISHSYNAFCVYVRAGKLNILAYQGRRNLVEEEAQKLSKFLNVPIKDLFPRNEKGEIIDDDKGSFDISSLSLIIVVIVIMIVLVGIMSSL